MYGAQKDGQQSTGKLSEHYEGAGEVNKRVAWTLANIENNHFTSEHTYSFENLSTVLKDAFTILDKNGKNYSENQMVRKICKKIKVPNNSEMNGCKPI